MIGLVGRYRIVAYAYPSSSNAVNLGFAKAGCYYSASTVGMGTLDTRTLKGFATLDEAVADAAERFPQHPWSCYSAQFRSTEQK